MIAFIGVKNLRVMVPAAVVNRHEAYANLNKASREEEALRKIIPAKFLAHRLILAADVEGLLRVARGNQVQAAGIKLVKGNGGIIRELVRKSLHAIERVAKILARLGASFADAWGKRYIAHFETIAVRVAIDDKGRMLGAEEIRSAGTRDFRHGDVGRQAFANATVIRNHRAERWMESDECAAGDRYRSRRAGHHIMIAAAVVWIFVANGSDDSELVRNRSQLGNAFRKLDSRHFRGNRLELATNIGRRVRLWIERLVVRRAAIHPDENAVYILCAATGRDGLGIRAQPHQIAQPQPDQAAKPHLNEIAAAHSAAVGRHAWHTSD